MANLDNSEINERSKQLKNLLSKLALSSELLSDEGKRNSVYKELESIYHLANDATGFRHYYSDIFAKMFDIKSDEKLASGTLENLIYNLRFINDHYHERKIINMDENGMPIDVEKNIRKLYDHVSLEIARMSYSDKGDVYVAQQGATLMNLSDKVEKMQHEAKDIRDSIEKSKLDYIAILGIFASVVLAFVGGMAFSTSVLENIKDVSIYRLVITALIIGVIFVTVIFLMFYFVGILSGRKLNDESSLNPLLLSYGLFIFLIVTVYIMWYHGDVEARNKRVDEQIQASIVESSDEPDITFQIQSEQNDTAAE